MTTVSCIVCKEERSVKNFKRHLITHDKHTLLNCKFCNKLCKNINSLTQHQRLCPNNAERVYISHTIGIRSWNNGLTKDTDERVAASSVALKTYYANHPAAGCCSKDFLGSEKHRLGSSKGGGYRENAGRSKKYKVNDSYGKEVVLQSTYELETSIILNEMGINWIRPKSLLYDNRKRYYADFYLVEYDVWLDPKNDYKAKQDEEKIKKVIEQNNVKLYVLLKHQLTKEYIGSLIQR